MAWHASHDVFDYYKQYIIIIINESKKIKKTKRQKIKASTSSLNWRGYSIKKKIEEVNLVILPWN